MIQYIADSDTASFSVRRNVWRININIVIWSSVAMLKYVVNRIESWIWARQARSSFKERLKPSLCLSIVSEMRFSACTLSGATLANFLLLWFNSNSIRHAIVWNAMTGSLLINVRHSDTTTTSSNSLKEIVRLLSNYKWTDTHINYTSVKHKSTQWSR